MKNVALTLLLVFLFGCDVPTASDSSSSVKVASVSETPCDSNTGPFGGGSGTASDPYLICSVDQFKNLTGSYNAVHAELRSDLDFTSISFTILDQFHGTLDGKNHEIKGISLTYGFDAGIFRSIAGTVKNLKLDSITINGSARSAALAGDMIGTGSIDNVHVRNSSVTGGTNSAYCAGLIIGESYGVITNSTTIGSLSGNRLGGIVGINRGTVQYVASSVNLSGTIKGRIVGVNYNDVLDCQYPNFAQPGTNPVGSNNDDIVNCN